MIKCNINRKRNKIQVKAGGTGYDISLETMAFIGQVFRGINKENPEAGTAFKKSIIAGLLDPNSPVWKEEE